MPEISQPIRFDTGIDAIVQRDDDRDARLPEFHSPLPGDAHYQHQLNDVLYPPSLEQKLIDSLRPDVTDRNLLNPTRFPAMIERTQNSLSEVIDNTDLQESRSVLRDAIGLLDEAKDLRDLLNNYRHVLHRA